MSTNSYSAPTHPEVIRPHSIASPRPQWTRPPSVTEALLYDRSLLIFQRLVDQDGRGDLSAQLAGVYLCKAVAMQSFGDLHEAVGLYERCISIRKQLVERQGHRELAGELACAQLYRAECVMKIGPATDEEASKTQKAFALLLRETERTEQPELARVLKWALETFEKFL